MVARTERFEQCGKHLRRARRDPFHRALALAFTALVLLTVTCSTTMLIVQTAGISHQADLLAGPQELLRRGLWTLAVVVVFTTLIAPFGKLIGLLYVLLMLRTSRPPRHLGRVFVAARWLAPWSMIEVFLL